MFKAGDKVAWTSQSQGSWTEKHGTVIANIPSGVGATQYISSGAKKSHSRFDKDISSIDRVLVAVPAGKDGKITHYYCPRSSVLTVKED